MKYRIKVGAAGESFAAEVLENMGFEILERNFRSRYGELDIIARRGNELHIVEVKTRMSDICGYPAEAVGCEKRKSLRRAAGIYISERKLYSYDICFDVFEIEGNYIQECI